jgi:hypothetical protein
MRVLATAINQGEHKLPEGHKATRYALAPGRALQLGSNNKESEVIEVDAKTCKIAEYTYCLAWVDGRTVAIFKVGAREVVQPTSPDPAPKRERSKAGPPRSSAPPSHEAERATPPPRGVSLEPPTGPHRRTPSVQAGKKPRKPIRLEPL